jgi:hypothetical protein
MKTVPDYHGGASITLMFAILCGLAADHDGRNPFLWGMIGGTITFVGVALVWATCGRDVR